MGDLATSPTVPSGSFTADLPAVVTVPVLLPLGTVASILACSTRTVRRRIADGSLPAVVDDGGRLLVRGDELRAYVDRLHRVPRRPQRSRPSARSAAGRFDFLHM
jgi:excisionase family DNA binding protein